MTALLLLVAVTIYWCFVEYDVIKKKYTNSSSITKRAKRSNLSLLLTTAFCFIVLYATFFKNWQSDISLYWSYTGSFIAFSGLLMRRTAIQTLGKHFDGLVQLKQGQQLIKHGLYRYLRHPSYTGTIIAFFGFGIASMSVLNTILFPLLYTACYYFRIQFEEDVLLQGFGDEYTLYRTESWSLLPLLGKQRAKS